MLDDIIAWLNQWTVDHYLAIGYRILRVILIWAAAVFFIRLGRFLINGFFESRAKGRFHVNKKKNDTLRALVQSILRYVIYFIGFLMIMDEIGIETTSIIATAGIGGLAIGFGAQSLVRDVITGFFIIFEDQYSVGDFIKIEDITGTVEEIGLRITKIRGFKGDINIIPNGQIFMVTNYSRGNSAVIVDVTIAYEADIDRAIAVIDKVIEKYAAANTDIVEIPRAVGIVEMDSIGLTLRVVGRTLPMKHWGVERDLRKAIKVALEENKIEIPYPRLVVINRD
ncbi:MAG TPA: mechanosensitive ion channel family protein [Clostridia bacterium]|nr:mechanosensitive ion channel family protein [Clostridia bacterium]